MRPDEHASGAQVLIALLRSRRPRIVCFVGMGIWKAFFGYLVSSKSVPAGSHTTSSKSLLGGAKKGAGRLLPENALMSYKLVHTFKVEEGDPSDTLIADATPPLIPKPEPSSLPTIKLEPDEDPPMRALDDSDQGIAPVTETLFFVMPNTSGLVSSYKVRPQRLFL